MYYQKKNNLNTTTIIIQPLTRAIIWHCLDIHALLIKFSNPPTYLPYHIHDQEKKWTSVSRHILVKLYNETINAITHWTVIYNLITNQSVIINVITNLTVLFNCNTYQSVIINVITYLTVITNVITHKTVIINVITDWTVIANAITHRTVIINDIIHWIVIIIAMVQCKFTFFVVLVTWPHTCLQVIKSPILIVNEPNASMCTVMHFIHI